MPCRGEGGESREEGQSWGSEVRDTHSMVLPCPAPQQGAWGG